MEKKFSLEIRVEIGFPSEKKAVHAVAVIAPDLNPGHEKQSRAEVVSNQKTVCIAVQAENEKRLFGSVNSLLNSMALIQKIQSTQKEL